jgi:hypothetical protein
MIRPLFPSNVAQVHFNGTVCQEQVAGRLISDGRMSAAFATGWAETGRESVAAGSSWNRKIARALTCNAASRWLRGFQLSN